MNNLLRLLTVVVVTASISLLLPTVARAVDHPWDDRPNDTTSIGNSPQVTDSPNPKAPVFTRVIDWTRWLYLEIKATLLGSRGDEIHVDGGDIPTKKSLRPSGTRK